MIQSSSLLYAVDPISAVAGAAKSPSASMSKAGNFMNSSLGILTISGIATIYSGMLYKGAAKQEKESQENIKKLDKLIATFKDSYSGYCPKGRDELTDPGCYCYTDDGKKNTTRTNSQVCISLWAKSNYKLSGGADNYGLGIAVEPVGCVNLNNEFDETCKCKKFVDAKGSNACKKGTSITLPNDTFSTGLATSSGVNNVLKFAANSLNGNPRFDLLSTGDLNASALKSKQVTRQVTASLEKDKNIKLPVIDENNVGKYAAALIGQKNIDDAMKSSSGAMNIGSSRSNNPAVENILKKAQAKAGLEMIGGSGLDAKSSAKKKLSFNFNDNSGNTSSGQVIQDFPEESEKNYKYKNSDISNNDSASIFEIISNRYVQSGLKRLFED